MSRSVLVLVGLLMMPVLPACNRASPQPDPVRPVRAVRVAGPDDLMVRSFPGVASASSEVNLSFRFGGTLISRASFSFLLADENNRV